MHKEGKSAEVFPSHGRQVQTQIHLSTMTHEMHKCPFRILVELKTSTDNKRS